MSGGDMTLDQRVTSLEIEVAQLRTALQGITGNWPTPSRLVMSWPCGDVTRRQLAPWWVAVKYAQEYNGGQYHTGYDFNMYSFLDSRQPVYVIADGFVRFAGRIDNAWLSAVIVEHTLENGRVFWTRYAHINPIPALQVGSRILRGTQVGNIADYGRKGDQDDHLHLDASWRDLGRDPDDWPGHDLDRVRLEYIDILPMIEERLP